MLFGDQRRPGPGEVLLSAEDVPDDDRELARSGNSGDLMASLAAHTQEEGAQRSG